jgi:large conductance mechanosensitive channel
MIKVMNNLNRKKIEEQAPATPPPPPADIQLLTEIRDILRKDSK